VNWIDELNLFRRYPYWAARRCIFVHVPKAAGTSINMALYGRPLGHYRATEIRRRFPRLFEESFVFSFVRNPWDRVLSAYRFAVQGRTPVMGVRDPSQYDIPEFETFERFLLEWLAPREVEQLDFIFQPQRGFITDASGESIVDYVGKVEGIAEQMQYVEDRLGIKIALPRVNRTGVGGGYTEAYKNERMVKLVADKYRDDIVAFDYEF
jgi:hypothetical protein